MSRCAHRTAQTDPSRRRSPLAAASPFCSRVPQNSGIKGLGQGTQPTRSRALTRARRLQPDQRDHDALAVRSAQRRSASSAAGAGGGGSPPPQRASTRRCAAARARRRVRALARRSVGRSFPRSADRRVLRGGRRRAALPAPPHAAPPMRSSLAAARHTGGGSRSQRDSHSVTRGARATTVGALVHGSARLDRRAAPAPARR